jgi:hypothetical protein
MSDESVSATPAAAKPARKGITPLGIVITAILAIALVVGGVLLTSGSLPPEPGEMGYLDKAVVAVSPAALAQLREAAQANDLAAMRNLNAMNAILTIEAERTSIRLVSSNDASAQLEILSGPYAGHRVWAPLTAVHRK